MACIPILGQRIPELKMVVDHLGQPPIGTRPQGQWSDDMRIAAENPRVRAKISGLGTASGMAEKWSAADVRPYVAFALDTFNPYRCMCGGDWPVCVVAGGYVKAWTIYREVLAEYPADVQERVLAGTAADFYGVTVGSDDP
jgi:L-fuconolactonase